MESNLYINYLNEPKNELIKEKKEGFILIKLEKNIITKRKKKQKYKLIYFIIPILIISISALISYVKILKYKPKKNKKHKPTKEDIYFEEKFPPLKESFDNAKSFLDKCLKGIIINNQSLKYSENPKVSAIITLHNCQKTVSRAIKSIQNQNISDIEIILVNDFSTDNTLSIIEEVEKQDPRIKIINNKKKYGNILL